MHGSTESLIEKLKDEVAEPGVSEGNENYLNDEKFEKDVIEFCEKYQNRKLSKISNREQVLQKAKDFVIQYQSKANNADSFLCGEITHYRIRQGALFSIVKKLIK